MLESRNWIGGEWITPRGGAVEIQNASRLEETVGIVHLSEAQDVHQAGDTARQALLA